MGLKMGLLGKKIGMTQKFNAKGEWVPLSVVQVGPCVVVDIKTDERDGYSALQIGFDDKSEKRTSKPQGGIFTKAQCAPKRIVREIRLSPEEITQFKVGQELKVDQVFSAGDIIDAIGTSKGKGFQGVMKRYHFKGNISTHGSHEYFRHGGSIGCRLTPGHVVKGKKMPGQMGNKRVTVQNLVVTELDPAQNLLLIRGAVPGSTQGYLMIKKAIKRAMIPFTLKVIEPEVQAEAEPTAETTE